MYLFLFTCLGSSAGLVPWQNIHPTTGGQDKSKPGWNAPFASKVKSSGAGIFCGAVGGIKDALYAEELLQNGDCDMVFVGREFLRNPTFVIDCGKALNIDLEYPNQYARAKI